MAGDCGTCTACCRVFSIPQIEKKAGDWCTHCDIGVGCKIYDSRPDTCIDFECLWLQSQRRVPDQQLPADLRPDRCKVVFSPATDPNIMSATTMPGSPGAWQRKNVRHIIERMVAAGMRVVIGPPQSTLKLMIDKYGQREVQMTPPDENGIQWNVHEEMESKP